MKKSKLHRVEAHATFFPCIKPISWIVKHVDLYNRNILNAKGHPITSLQEFDIALYYDLVKGDLSLKEYLIKKFPLKKKDLCKV
jgi:hypothetical protein